MEAEFSLIDVFRDRPFGGNQLAVFPRAEGLSEEVMRQRARETTRSTDATRGAVIMPLTRSRLSESNRRPVHYE